MGDIEIDVSMKTEHCCCNCDSYWKPCSDDDIMSAKLVGRCASYNFRNLDGTEDTEFNSKYKLEIKGGMP